jgi:hypothetical protein
MPKTGLLLVFHPPQKFLLRQIVILLIEGHKNTGALSDLQCHHVSRVRKVTCSVSAFRKVTHTTFPASLAANIALWVEYLNHRLVA